MGFTYDINATGADLTISKVRLELGDTVEDSGVLPDGSNLSDEEISLYLDTYSDDVTQATGALCSVLARRWATVADISVGPRRESLSQVSKRWTDMANELNPGHASFVTYGIRGDGYADNAESESEYT